MFNEFFVRGMACLGAGIAMIAWFRSWYWSGYCG